MDAGTSSFALLTDGTTIEIREAGQDDRESVRALHAGLSRESLYLRFFSINPRLAEQIADRICRPPDSGHAALLALLRGTVIGVAGYERIDGEPGTAEIAMAVADHMHHRGVGTLLLEHLGALAHHRGVREFRADTLADNHAMLRLLAGAGLPLRRRLAAGVIESHVPLAADEHYLETVAAREGRADVESLRHLLRPASVAVVGAGRDPASVGHSILRNAATYGFTGSLYAVNPHASEIAGVPCYPSVRDLPEPPELAVVVVPAAGVLGVAEDCGRRGARGLVVITSGLGKETGARLLAICREYGMRLVGPNCFGVANTEREIRLDATFFARHPVPGRAGVVVQSGGVGIAVAEHLSRLGIGVSTFASVGDKYDVSSNDMLMWWAADQATTLAVLYVESFGNPRKFARTARRVGATMPILTVPAGLSAPGQRAAGSHTAAAATAALVQQALFDQAGIITAGGLGELLDVAAFLAFQPVPAGPRVAVVSNAGGAAVLAADACVAAGLTVPALPAPLRHRLAEVLPRGAATGNPVDTTATAPPSRLRRAIEILARSDEVDAVLAVVVPTAVGDLTTAVVSAQAGDKPLSLVALHQTEGVSVRPGPHRGVPSYGAPEAAARALGRAWSYGRWRSRPPGAIPEFTDVGTGEAKKILADFLAAHPDGGWLPPERALRLLGCYRLPLIDWRWVEMGAAAAAPSESTGVESTTETPTETPTVEDAVEDAVAAAAAELGGRVALKAHVPEVIHKSRAGAVELDLRGEGDVRKAYRRLAEHFGERLLGVVVQRMAADGVELLLGAVQEPVFGPLVVFGLGGTATEALDDRAARLAPLTDGDAADLIESVRVAPLLLGERGAAGVDVPALREAVLRLSQLVDELPEVAELDLNPVIARADGMVAVDARVRVVPAPTRDPYLRRLR
ncbi:MAG TPA: GNAT family N-acetyltransferase [Streptosporangiaceae bacterium]